MSESERIRKIHSFVQKIRSSEEMGVKYMQAWEEKVLEREEEEKKEEKKEGTRGFFWGLAGASRSF